MCLGPIFVSASSQCRYNYQTSPQEVSIEQHVKCYRHQLLVTNYLPNQIWRVANIQRHPWSPFQAKKRVRPQWPMKSIQWLTWTSHASIPVPYSGWLGIKPPKTPRILAIDPKWIHTNNYKQTCTTEQVAQDAIWHNQIMWWCPQATNSRSLPQRLCGRSSQCKCWFCTDHNTWTTISYILLIWNHSF